MKQQNSWLKITFQPDMSEGARCQNSLSKQKCGPGRPSNTNEPETLMVGTPSTNIRKRNCSRRLISACGNVNRGTLTGYRGALCAGNKSRAQFRDEKCEINGSVQKNQARLPGPKVTVAWLAFEALSPPSPLPWPSPASHPLSVSEDR